MNLGEVISLKSKKDPSPILLQDEKIKSVILVITNLFKNKIFTQ